jgi:hypothetical protein
MAAVFGEAVVDMDGHIEKAQDFMKERHSIDHIEGRDAIVVEEEGRPKA